jgi:hypothetical protein
MVFVGVVVGVSVGVKVEVFVGVCVLVNDGVRVLVFVIVGVGVWVRGGTGQFNMKLQSTEDIGDVIIKVIAEGTDDVLLNVAEPSPKPETFG